MSYVFTSQARNELYSCASSASLLSPLSSLLEMHCRNRVVVEENFPSRSQTDRGDKEAVISSQVQFRDGMIIDLCKCHDFVWDDFKNGFFSSDLIYFYLFLYNSAEAAARWGEPRAAKSKKW